MGYSMQLNQAIASVDLFVHRSALIGSPADVSSRILPSCVCSPGSASSTFLRPPPASRIRPCSAREIPYHGQLTMAHVDCNTIPILWQYASRFTLYDHIFQYFTGPSTPGNIAIMAAQTGNTQWALHPNEAFTLNQPSGTLALSLSA